MAQLRHDYQLYVDRDVEVVAIGPEDARQFAAYWEKESLPFIGLPDSKARLTSTGYSTRRVFIIDVRNFIFLS
jgi:peroxiredoxin